MYLEKKIVQASRQHKRTYFIDCSKNWPNKSWHCAG